MIVGYYIPCWECVIRCLGRGGVIVLNWANTRGGMTVCLSWRWTMIGCLFYSSPEIKRSLKVGVDGNIILSFLPKEALLIAIYSAEQSVPPWFLVFVFPRPIS